MSGWSLSELRREAFLDATANNCFLDFGLHEDAFVKGDADSPTTEPVVGHTKDAAARARV